MLTDMLFAGVETISSSNKFAFCFQKIDQLQSGHVSRAASMKTGIRTKAGFDG